MAFVSTVGADAAQLAPAAAIAAPARSDFYWLDRLVLLGGGGAIGTIVGFLTLIAFGRQPTIDLMVGGSMLVMVALHLSTQTLREGGRTRLYLIALAVNGAALLCWPLALAPALSPISWIAPFAAAASLVVLAWAWRGPSRAIYRFAWQGAIIAVLASYQAGLSFMT
jgi:hypothetical protein